MKTSYIFRLDLQVDDKQQLYDAALAHPDCHNPDDLHEEDGSINIENCLIMLLDPGHLPGCDIRVSAAVSFDGG